MMTNVPWARLAATLTPSVPTRSVLTNAPVVKDSAGTEPRAQVGQLSIFRAKFEHAHWRTSCPDRSPYDGLYNGHRLSGPSRVPAAVVPISGLFHYPFFPHETLRKFSNPDQEEVVL